jgi:hypothetical protein
LTWDREAIICWGDSVGADGGGVGETAEFSGSPSQAANIASKQTSTQSLSVFFPFSNFILQKFMFLMYVSRF